MAERPFDILYFFLVCALVAAFVGESALGEEVFASVGFGGGFPSTVRKFSFKDLKKKVLQEVPSEQPTAEPAPPKSVLFDRPIVMPLVSDDESPAVKEEASVDHYAKSFAQYEDFKDLVTNLPKGVKPDDVALDLAQIRTYGIGLETEEMKSCLRNFVRHTGKFAHAGGELDVEKLEQVLLRFDIELTLRVNRAILDLDRQMQEEVSLNRSSSINPSAAPP